MEAKEEKIIGSFLIFNIKRSIYIYNKKWEGANHGFGRLIILAHKNKNI
jgi:hypothetical protein